MDTVSPAWCSFEIRKERVFFTPDFRFAMIVGDKSQKYCDESNVQFDWDKSWNDSESVLNVYRSDLCTLSFGSTVITALFK